MHLFGDESEKELHRRFFEVMEGREDPLKEYILPDILDKVQSVLDACYSLGVNPLMPLRRAFPYMWEYHRVSDPRQVRSIVTNSDFVWRAGGDDLVTAKMTYRTLSSRPSWFWVDSNTPPEKRAQVAEFARAAGGNLVTQNWGEI